MLVKEAKGLNILRAHTRLKVPLVLQTGSEGEYQFYSWSGCITPIPPKHPVTGSGRVLPSCTGTASHALASKKTTTLAPCTRLIH